MQRLTDPKKHERRNGPLTALDRGEKKMRCSLCSKIIEEQNVPNAKKGCGR